MRYILNDRGYIAELSDGHLITCNNNTCTEYTGTIPDGYTSLEEWAINANINAYKIVDGNLTYDSEEDTRLQAEWEKEYSGSNSLGSWTKLADGTIIQRGSFKINAMINSAWGSWYECSVTFPNFPIPFTTNATVTITPRGRACWLEYQDSSLTGIGPVFIARPVADTAYYDYWFDYIAIGK